MNTAVTAAESSRLDRIAFPDEYCVLTNLPWTLYFDPVNFSLLKVNEHGEAVLRCLKEGLTVAQSVAHLSETYAVPLERMEEIVHSFLRSARRSHFLHEGVYRRHQVTQRFNYPQAIYLSLTDRCNLQCIYCYNHDIRQANLDENKKELAVEVHLRTLEIAAAVGIRKVTFTGGEPLLYPGLFTLAEKTRELGLANELLTNGTLITPHNAATVAAHFDAVTISLDSADPALHETYRGEGTFARVVAAVRALQAVGTTWLTISAVATAGNIPELPHLYRFALHELGVNQVIHQFYLPFPCSVAQPDLCRTPTIEQIRRILEELVQFRSHQHYRNSQPGLPRRFSCGAGTGEIGISANGDVFPCHNLQLPEFYCGNIAETDLKTILDNSPIMKRFYDMRVEEIDTCSNCNVRSVCGGGCRALANLCSGKITGHNSLMCDFHRLESEKKLWLAAEQCLSLQAEGPIRENTKC